MAKVRAWSETREVLRKVAEQSEDRDIAQALEVIAGLEELIEAWRQFRTTGGFVKGDTALARLERVGYSR